MSQRVAIDRPGRIVFVCGVVLIVVAAGLGAYLATPRSLELTVFDWHTMDDQERQAKQAALKAEVEYSANVHTLMWMTFGLGTGLSLYGLRLITRPDLRFQPLPPIGSSRDLSENPK
jgi:hypothetical protein